MYKAFLVFLGTFFVLSQSGLAQEVVKTEQDKKQEAEYAHKAKNRLYAGGKDEEDLKIQPQITNPPRKLAPQAEVVGSSDE